MRKMAKRMMECIFLVMLCAGILAGCGKKEDPVAVQPEGSEKYYEEEETQKPEESEVHENNDIIEEEPEEIKEDESVQKEDTEDSDSEGDEGEGVIIADGEYVTDEEYEGELSADGKTMTITTALSEFVNSPEPTYPKQTYVFTVADSCKCVEFQEETIESSFFDKKELISDFLKGLSGLPITLKFKNNELVEIMFSS